MYAQGTQTCFDDANEDWFTYGAVVAERGARRPTVGWDKDKSGALKRLCNFCGTTKPKGTGRYNELTAEDEQVVSFDAHQVPFYGHYFDPRLHGAVGRLQALVRTLFGPTLPLPDAGIAAVESQSTARFKGGRKRPQRGLPHFVVQEHLRHVACHQREIRAHRPQCGGVTLDPPHLVRAPAPPCHGKHGR